MWWTARQVRGQRDAIPWRVDVDVVCGRGLLNSGCGCCCCSGLATGGGWIVFPPSPKLRCEAGGQPRGRCNGSRRWTRRRGRDWRRVVVSWSMAWLRVVAAVANGDGRVEVEQGSWAARGARPTDHALRANGNCCCKADERLSVQDRLQPRSKRRGRIRCSGAVMDRGTLADRGGRAG